ncbi:MAG: hypothetical protein IJP80_06615, partial [Bacteroidales bacterium]|nr:hypothetical protein [Bacteroidales bacterium]
MMEKQFTREELSERLKELANDETNFPIHRGAMCYEPAMPCLQKTRCSHCGKRFRFSGYDGFESYENYLLEQIRALGYDAYIESWCPNCAAKEGYLSSDELGEMTNEVQSMEDDGFVADCVGRCVMFFFRLKGEEKYHRALLRDHNDLKALCAFLRQE